MEKMTPQQFRELFGRRIIEVRKNLGWSQAELARKMGTSSGFVCDYEKARQCASLNTILKFANTLGVQPAELMGESDQPPKRANKNRKMSA